MSCQQDISTHRTVTVHTILHNPVCTIPKSVFFIRVIHMALRLELTIVCLLYIGRALID